MRACLVTLEMPFLASLASLIRRYPRHNGVSRNFQNSSECVWSIEVIPGLVR